MKIFNLRNIINARGVSVYGIVRVLNDETIYVKLDKKSVIESLSYYEGNEEVAAFIAADGKVIIGK